MKIKLLVVILLAGTFIYFNGYSKKSQSHLNVSNQYITILGVAQDAGYPQINCEKECCEAYYDGKEARKLVSSLGLIDLSEHKKYIFDATPDFKEQIHLLKSHVDNSVVVDGIFLTHAHMGHYTGLLELGFEAMNAINIHVYAMPKMTNFLKSNGPWSQLVTLKNIELRPLIADSIFSISPNLKVVPFLVPHRDEFSETIGFKIIGPNKTALFIPDIDKWQLWDKNIIEEVKKVDYAFLDATFFKNGEIPRPMEDVPHPFIEETIKLFENESFETKQKVLFIHFNHSNPAIQTKHHLQDNVIKLGFNFAKQGMRFDL